MRRFNQAGRILCGDALTMLRTLPDASVHCCVTSPPYWGLRDYGQDDQLGLEATPDEYVARMVGVFGEVRRVLRDDGTLWLNLGDSYAGSVGTIGRNDANRAGCDNFTGSAGKYGRIESQPSPCRTSLKPKDLVGIPWRVAFALQADGWYLRSDIIWAKPNPMPESVTDRPTKAHEYLFLLAKSARYFYDAESIREVGTNRETFFPATPKLNANKDRNDQGRADITLCAFRNRRTVWTVATQPYAGAHFAVFPPKLIEPCIRAGTSQCGACWECGAPWVRVVERGVSLWEHRKQQGEPIRKGGDPETIAQQYAGGWNGAKQAKWKQDHPDTTLKWNPGCECAWRPDTSPATVMDPFLGSGTTAAVAKSLGRNYIGIELNPEYVELAKKRLSETQEPLFPL